eukprot:Nk52_evm21s218 gene=Nk52_evmTU21s218
MESIAITLTSIPALDQLPNDGYCPLPEAIVRLDTPEGKFVYQEQYKNHPRFLKSKDTELQKLADNGTIARSNPNCRWNSAIHTVFKKHRSELTAADFKEAETRPCIDVRLLNLMLLCTLFPLTNANTMIAACSGFAIYSLIDLTRGFHHMPILPEHAEKLSFTWKGERWHYKRAPFGLKHVPGLFSRLINKVLQGIPNCMAYLDDIVVFTDTVEEHIRVVKMVLEALTKAKLKIGIKKCYFGFKRLRVLGRLVSAAGIAIDPMKAESIYNHKKLRTGKDIQSFLGMTNFFRAHIPR